MTPITNTIHPTLQCPAYWNGRPFPKAAERLVLPDGRILEDAVIWPDFIPDELGLDPEQIILDKLGQRRAKYPIEKARGRSEKYDQL